MFAHFSQYFNLDPRWQILTTEGQPYQVQVEDRREEGPQISREAEKTLEAMHSVIDLTHAFSYNATKGLVYFTAFNIVCYHFTGWISGIATMYAITIVIFGWTSYEFSKLEAGSFQLKATFVLIVGSRREPNHLTWEEIQELPERQRDHAIRDYHTTTPVLREGQQPSLDIRDGSDRVKMTLVHVQRAITQIEQLRRSLPILNYYALPLRTPLKNLSTNLRHIESHLKLELRA